jgi:hypothetical protein
MKTTKTWGEHLTDLIATTRIFIFIFVLIKIILEGFWKKIVRLPVAKVWIFQKKAWLHYVENLIKHLKCVDGAVGHRLEISFVSNKGQSA